MMKGKRLMLWTCTIVNPFRTEGHGLDIGIDTYLYSPFLKQTA